MPLTVLGTLIGYMIMSSFSPGPGNILALNTMTHFGWQKGRSLMLGICTGYLCVQLLCTFAIYGISTMLNPVLSIIQYMGAIYMVWLAIHIIRNPSGTENNTQVPLFKVGFLLQLVNVKIYFYIMTLLSVYLIPYMKSLSALCVAGIGVVTVGSIATLVWAFIGVSMQKVFKQHERIVNGILGGFLVYCAWMILRS